nr:hypothetical protein [Tanacetum cinerariifolium]
MADMNIPATDAPVKQAHAIAPPTRTDEEFVQSIQTFLTDKKNLATASRGKKKTTHMLIPSIRYVGKDGREIFGIPIPNALLTHEIKRAPYYGEYQEHVAKYQQHLDAEHGKAAEGGATKSSKATKVTKPKAAKATKPASDPKPKPDSRRFQPFPEVQGKEKVVEEQVAHDLPTLQTPKNKSPVDQLDQTLVYKMKSRLDQTLVHKIKARLDQTLLHRSVLLEKQQEEEPGKTNAEAEVRSMVSVPIHQATTSTVMTTTTIPPPPPQPQQSTTDPTLLKRIDELKQHMVSKAVDEIVTDAVDWAMQAPLRARFSDLPTVDIKEILQQRIFESKSYEAHEHHKKLYDALENSSERNYSDQLLSDLEEAHQKKRKRRDVPRTPSGSPPPQLPHPPPPAGTSGAPGNKALSSSKSAASVPQSMAWTKSDTRYEYADLYGTQALSPTDSLIPHDSVLDE